jgi:ribonuclease D
VVSSPNQLPKVVTKPGEVETCCREAALESAVAVDSEADSFHSYHHKLCLIQLSYGEQTVLLDPLVLSRADLAPFAVLLSNPRVVKLMHGADYDLRMFDRDLGMHAAPVRDTQVAAQLLGEPQSGLAALLAKELGVELDKSQQRADWSIRPLPPELLVYAAGDTAHLRRLAEIVGVHLAALGRVSWWEEECAALAEVRWQPAERDEFSFERVKGASRLRGKARDRIAALHGWREQFAEKEDVAPFRVMGGDALIALAERAPADMQALAKVPGVGSATVRRFGAVLLQLIAGAPPAPVRPPREHFRVDRERERRLKELRAVRDGVATQLAVDPGVLAPRAGLEAVVDRRPASAAELRDCLGRRWRTEVLAPVLLPAVAAWSVEPAGGEPQ